MNARAALVIRWIVALLLVWASLSKIARPQEFLAHLLAYHLPLPQGLLRLTAVILPWVELLAGVGLLTRLWPRGSLALALCLFTVFTLATGQAWLRGLDISCGCLDTRVLGLTGSGPSLQWLDHVGFAFFRAALLLAGCFLLVRDEAAAGGSGKNPDAAAGTGA